MTDFVAGQAELLAARVVGLTSALGYAQRTRATSLAALKRALVAQGRGDIRSAEVQTRRIAASDSDAAARVAEVALDTARHDLNKLLGLDPETRFSVAPPPLVQPPVEDAQALFSAARSQRLDLQALQAGYQSQNAAVRKAMMDAFPSFQVSVARTQDTAKNQAVDPAVNFALPLWNRNRGGIAVAKATQAQLRAEYAARLFATRADIAELVSQLKVEARQRAGIEGQIAPIRPIVDATEAAARRGDLALAAAEAARQSLADKELALATLNQSMAEQRVTLQLALGGPLVD